MKVKINSESNFISQHSKWITTNLCPTHFLAWSILDLFHFCFTL